MSNLASIRDLLLPGLERLVTDYAMIKPQYGRIFETKKSSMATVRTAEMRMLPLAQVKQEGQAVAFDNNASQRYIFNVEHLTLGLGYSLTREMIEDNQYKEQFKTNNLNLKSSFKETKEFQGINVLNTANIYNAAIGGDGVALCSTAHPIDGGTYANRPVIDMDLGEASLLSASMAIRQNFKDQAGLKVYARPEMLIVPVPLWPVAERLIRTDLRPGTSDNDTNAILNKDEGGIRDYMVSDYLSSNFAWFLKTNIPGLVHYKRRPFSTDMDTDQVSQNLLIVATERYSFTYDNPRALWGTFPTS